MKLTLRRIHFDPDYTIGELSIDGVLQCFTLEDTVREKHGVPVKEWKVQNKTAIPTGTYKVVISTSNRFKRKLPELLDVPGFAGIRIHAGNSSADTEGCVLVGKQWGGGDWISDSRAAFNQLFSKMLTASSSGQEIEIEIL